MAHPHFHLDCDAATRRTLACVALAAAFALGQQTSWAFGPGDSAVEASGSGAQLYVGAASAHAAQGYLGVGLRDVTSDQVAALKLKEPRGAEIVVVDHDAPAGKVGLREHDVILQMNGQTIEDESQIHHMLHESPPGKTIILVISRDGQQMTVTAQMASQEEVDRQAWEQHLTVPEPQDTPAPPPDSPSSGSSSSLWMHGNSFIGTILMSPAYTGAMLEKMSPQLAGYFGVPSGTGLLVRSVEVNSPAAQAGMQAGDVVIRADARSVASTSDWAKAIKQSHGHSLAITVLRDKKEQTLTLTPDGKKRSSLELPSLRFPNVAGYLGLRG
jgi:serine protease Do